MPYELKFGDSKCELDLKNAVLIKELLPNEVSHGLKGEQEVRRSLENPICSDLLRNIVKNGEKIVIITSDITRPMPSSVVMPLVLSELEYAGVSDNDITIVFALGIHRSHTEEEKKKLVGDEIFKRIKCIDSDSNDFKALGKTKNGTPVEIFTPVCNADRVICIGNIEYHYFAGYSGGAKAIMPGVSTKNAIKNNHANMVLDKAHAGNIKDNPVRLDIEEIEDFIKIDFIVNVVLNEKKEIVKTVSGHYIKAHREGCKFLDELYKVFIPKLADIVIASSGGFPKDINLYQGQKALDNAKHAVKDGGVIILVASCKEGLGEDTFEKWLLSVDEPSQLITNIKANFELGGHKAAAIAMVMKNADVYLVSDMEAKFVQKIFMQPFDTLQKAFDSACKKFDNPQVIIMPVGGSTLPVLE